MPAAAPRAPLPPARRTLRAVIILTPVALLIAIAYLTYDLWSQMPPEVVPRHRAEAVCFTLAQPDPVTLASFAPPMRIEPSAALVQGRFAPGTSAAMALRQVMRLDESMVVDESQRAIGDYTVSALWLSLPPGAAGLAPSGTTADAADGGHWLVLTWLEGADLAVCNFRFARSAGSSETPTREWSVDERRWGVKLLARTLTSENFRAGSLPHVGLRVMRGAATMPVFGPETHR